MITNLHSVLLQNQRNKPIYRRRIKNIDRYSANYSYTNHNFVIQNNGGNINKRDKYFPVFCILKNILISNIKPDWNNTIKGDDFNNDYPAIKILFMKLKNLFFQK